MVARRYYERCQNPNCDRQHDPLDQRPWSEDGRCPPCAEWAKDHHGKDRPWELVQKERQRERLAGRKERERLWKRWRKEFPRPEPFTISRYECADCGIYTNDLDTAGRCRSGRKEWLTIELLAAGEENALSDSVSCHDYYRNRGKPRDVSPADRQRNGQLTIEARARCSEDTVYDPADVPDDYYEGWSDLDDDDPDNPTLPPDPSSWPFQ
jgi:hypothetical protein